MRGRKFPCPVVFIAAHRSSPHRLLVMDARDIKSDLLALQRLYGLLKSDGDGMTNPASNMLDKHSRLVLKNLLDSATQRSLEVYSEIFAGQVGVLRTPCASHLQQTDDTIKEQSSRLQLTREVDQSYRNDLGSDKERKVDGLDLKLWNDQRFIRQRSQIDSVEQSTPSADATGTEFRKKRCRVCQRNTIKQIATNDDTAKYPDILTYPKHEENNHSDHVPWNIEQETGSVLRYKTHEPKIDKRRLTGPFVSNLSGVGSTGFSSDTVVPNITKVCNSNFEAIYKGEEADSISKEASKAIEQLESCISDLKIGSDHVHLFGEFSGQHENMDSNDVVNKLTSQSAQSPLKYPSHGVYSVSTEVINQPLVQVQPKNSMLCQSNGHFSRSVGTYEMRESNEEENMKKIIDKIGSGNWRTTHNDFGPNQIQHVWNVGVAADHETSPWPSTFSSAPKMASPHQIRLAMKNERNRHGVLQPSKPANTFGHPNYSEKLQSIDCSRKITSKWGTRGKKHPPNTTATLQDRSHQSDRQHKNGVATSRNSMTASRTSLNQQELEDTASSLYSSNMRSQQASSYGSVGEDYSFSDQTGSHYITSSTSSESGASPQSHGTMRDYDSYTSKSEDDRYLSPSGDEAHEVTTSSSAKSEGYSSYNQPMNRNAESSYSSMKSTSRKKVPERISRSASGINHKKQRKTWKRLKDRLGIIFHQHHHHHHHHHHHDDHHRSRWKKMNVSTLFRKREGKIIHSKQGDEAYGERAVENMRKSLIHDKYQKGQFHGLVEAFMRHIWHSKKSKVAKRNSFKLAKNQRGRKKALKKSRWLKLQHHRRGNFPYKAHVKLALGKKKTHVKALRS